jgi:hypothetical protein
VIMASNMKADSLNVPRGRVTIERPGGGGVLVGSGGLVVS